jgi:hypothetical protein
MQITIHDEASRRAVLYAIWSRAARGIGERDFYDQLCEEAESAINPCNDAPSVLITNGVTLLTATLLDVEGVRAAPVGTRVQLSMSSEALRDVLDRCIARIEEIENDFWRAPPESRNVFVATHDAAVRLCDDLTEPAEAVA